MAGTIIDQLTTIFDFKIDTSGITKADAAMDKFRHKTEKANETLEFFKRGIEVIGVALGLEKINEWANEWDNAQNKLRSVGLTGDELASTMQQLKDIADTSGTSVESVTELYQQLDATMGEMLGKQNLLTMVDNLNKVFAINATESGAAKAAMMDMAKGLENTTVNWMEIKRAMMDVPGLANIINQHFKAMGTTTAEALQGATFASKDFVKILIDAQDQINKQFAATAVTVPRATQHLMNSFMEFFSVLRQNSGITDFLVAGINGIANAMGVAAKWMGTHANTMKAIGISLGAVFTALGVRMAMAFAPVLIEFAPIILAIGAVILILDDLITYIKGGNSVIGSMIKSIKEWYASFATTHPMIKSVVDAISSLVSWISDLVVWFFKSGEASKAAGGAIDILAGALNFIIGIIELVLNVVANLFEALGNIGKALGNFAFSAVQAVTMVWDKFKQFRDWLLNSFVNIGKFLLKPFENMYEAIISPITKAINYLKSSTVGRWIVGKLGVDLTSTDKATGANTSKFTGSTSKNDMVFKPSEFIPNKNSNVVNLNNMINAPLPNITPQSFQHSTASSYNDNSNIVLNISVPAHSTQDMISKAVSDGLNTHKQAYKIGVMNNDSKIAR